MGIVPTLPDDTRGRPIQALKLGETYVINFDTTSTSATQEFKSGVVRIVSDLVCSFNPYSTAAVIATNVRFPADQAEYIAVRIGDTMHAIATATGRLWITEVI